MLYIQCGGWDMGLMVICCGMAVQGMIAMLGVSVGKMKTLTVEDR